ncbi:hypothetical protein HAX54_023100 [Datura stramonium]|uniref:Uncharacterized protein n=1 Tax=Datura stramonium TaxID=4076 RepID=A0ABS8RLC5_DATST|nr:hypothetical protein [Datura stramonium]
MERLRGNKLGRLWDVSELQNYTASTENISSSKSGFMGEYIYPFTIRLGRGSIFWFIIQLCERYTISIGQVDPTVWREASYLLVIALALALDFTPNHFIQYGSSVDRKICLHSHCASSPRCGVTGRMELSPSELMKSKERNWGYISEKMGWSFEDDGIGIKAATTNARWDIFLLNFMGFDFHLLQQTEAIQKKAHEKRTPKKRKRKDVGGEIPPSKIGSKRSRGEASLEKTTITDEASTSRGLEASPF